jgi:MarR family 2-MHQ and catechol resistance regulon transcriptional repressor
MLRAKKQCTFDATGTDLAQLAKKTFNGGVVAIETELVTTSENLAAKDAARFKDRMPWIDQTSIEANVAIANTYAAIMNAFDERLQTIGEGKANGRNRILRLIYLTRPERLAQGEIGRELSVTSANVTYLIDGMVREGLVNRIVNPNDRRVTFVELTPKGEQLAERIVPVIGKFMAEVVDCLSEEETSQLNHLLERVRCNAERLKHSDPR